MLWSPRRNYYLCGICHYHCMRQKRNEGAKLDSRSLFSRHSESPRDQKSIFEVLLRAQDILNRKPFEFPVEAHREQERVPP